MRTDILILHPSLLNFFPGSKEEQGFSEKKPAKEITAQVDQLYRDMYAGTTGLDDFIEDLKVRQKGDREDREIFAWCLHSIFDEYKFAKNYPPRELTMTGILFGGIIDSRLVKDIPAFVATRYVLDACRTNPNEPMHSFGINALSVLRRSLVDFPGLCRSLLEIPSLHEQHPVLINDIVAALTERAELDQQGGVKAAFPALKLPVLVEEGLDEFVEPEPKKKDAIMFIINQIAPSNYEQKSRDLLNLFEDQYSRWFAHYFIDVRVSLEQNRHDLYMNIIELLNSQVLEKHILWETYRKTRDLINAEATISSASERTTLKTIALWLGRLTLARNKPIRMRELSVKDLLIQGFDNKRLIVAIPFVCNLLVSCKDSMIFHLPNPWLVAILGLLVELYHFAELRLNLKFEIEVMFSKLEIAMDQVNPSNVLRTHVPPPPPQEDIPNRLQMEFDRAIGELSGGQRFQSQDSRLVRVQAAETEAAAQEAQDLFYASVNELIARLPEKMHFPNDYPAFQAPSAKQPVHDAIGRAIQDIIQPVVERSVTIAGISTRDLMSKDFANEPDAAKLRHAAHSMVKNLAGNLATVTCKEPLRAAMLANIRSTLQENSIPDEMVPDHMLQGFVNVNLEAACSVVKDASQDKASKDIEINMQAHFAARRAHRESRSNQPFSDSASIGGLVPQASLPLLLQVRPGGLLPAQMRVYEDFIEPAKVYTHDDEGSMYHDKTGYQQELDSHSMGHSPHPPSVSVAAAVERFQSIASDIDIIIASAPARSVTELPVDHELRRQIQTAVVLVSHPAIQDPAGAALSIAQKVVQLLYRSETSLGREVYVLMLQQLCETIRVVNQEVRDWLIYADDKVCTLFSKRIRLLTSSVNSMFPSQSPWSRRV
jgi:CCR4-NOT transcription complex subunit 1